MMISVLRSMGLSDEEIIGKIVENSNLTRDDVARVVCAGRNQGENDNG